jgi:Rod binding domain-containing protein
MIGYLMKTMRDGAIRGEEPGNAMETYENMLDGQVSKEISRSSALGIGDTLYAKLEPLIKVSGKPEVIPPEDKSSVSN